jgi:putative DNA primase/helicase
MNETTYEQDAAAFDDVHERFLSGIGKLLPPTTPPEPQRLVECTSQTQREQELDRLSKLSPADYGAARKAASDRLGIPVAFLDAERDARRKADKQARPGQGAEITFEEIPAAADPVDGAAVADRLTDIFTRFVVLPRYGEIVLALWVLFTYCVDQFEIAPRIDLESPEKSCGKTTVLVLLFRLVKRALLSSNVTPSVIFRVISTYHPTLLIDEMDTFIDANEELRGVLNSGHTRDAATIVRNVGDQHEPRSFSTWAAMAHAHIGFIPDTVKHRAISLPMKRKKPGERVASLRQVGPAAVALRAELRTLVGEIVRWVEDESPRLANLSPVLPDGLSGDRAADNWVPLLAIADILGGTWPDRARTAALVFSGHEASEADSIKTELLTDIHAVYARDDVDRLASADLCGRLSLLEERPWSEWKKGKPITPPQLARQLKPFRVSSRTIRLAGQGLVKGYLLEDFADAFERYLPLSPPDNPLSKRNNDTSRAQSGDDRLFQSVTEGTCYVSENGLNPAPRTECVSVTDRNGVSEGEESIQLFQEED